MLRELHQHIHTEHDAQLRRTVGAIENVIDDHLSPNLAVLHEVLQATADPTVHAALNLVLKRTRAAMRALGDLHTQVRPDTLDDPLGLPHMLAVIEQELGRSSWTGRRQFEIEGEPVAVAPPAQQEVWRIAHEVLRFVTHRAAAEALLVHLKYPGTPGQSIQFTIRWLDRQTTEPSTTSRLYVEQCARVMGGHVAWQSHAAVGSSLRVTFPASLALGLQ